MRVLENLGCIHLKKKTYILHIITNNQFTLKSINLTLNTHLDQFFYQTVILKQKFILYETYRHAN